MLTPSFPPVQVYVVEYTQEVTNDSGVRESIIHGQKKYSKFSAAIITEISGGTKKGPEEAGPTKKILLTPREKRISRNELRASKMHKKSISVSIFLGLTSSDDFSWLSWYPLKISKFRHWRKLIQLVKNINSISFMIRTQSNPSANVSFCFAFFYLPFHHPFGLLTPWKTRKTQFPLLPKSTSPSAPPQEAVNCCERFTREIDRNIVNF